MAKVGVRHLGIDRKEYVFENSDSRWLVGDSGEESADEKSVLIRSVRL